MINFFNHVGVTQFLFYFGTVFDYVSVICFICLCHVITIIINLLTPELNPSAQHRIFYWGF
jgi:hypothetical protein